MKAVPPDPAGIDIKRVFNEFAEKGRLPESCGMFGGYVIAKEEDAIKRDPARCDSLGAISTFVKEFFPSNGKRPDSVRTLLRQEQDDGKFFERIGSNEILYTGQTSDWIVSEDGVASYALVFKPCGDRRKETGDVEMANFPPKAVLESFVTWLIMVVGLQDEKEYSLRVGIVDMGQVLYNGWNWSVTPKDAKAYIEELTTAYLEFLDAPDGDGCYLDYGYSKMATALSEARKKKKINCVPKNDEEWKKVIDEFSSDDFWGGDNGFNNNLVIERVVEPLSRMPENKEDDGGDGDLKIVKYRFEKLFMRPISGTRKPVQKEEA